MDESNFKIARFFREAGVTVVDVDGIYWYEYSGFMVPAYLPHCIPNISPSNARKACKYAKLPFARWVNGYGALDDGEWWHVVREGRYDPADCSSNTRSKINRGKKKLIARQLTSDEVMNRGYAVCSRAVERFDDEAFLPSYELFQRRVLASMKVPGVMEYFGVYSGDKLVALSENLIQEDAVFWETIWYDPAYLGSYSSYVLTDFMLNNYLNERKFLYVSDGSRSIYHATDVQDFFVQKFGFKKKFLRMYIYYRPIMRIVVKFLYPMVTPFLGHIHKVRWRQFKRLGALVRQEKIRRECMSAFVDREKS
jgi:hypothetical protein